MNKRLCELVDSVRAALSDDGALPWNRLLQAYCNLLVSDFKPESVWVMVRWDRSFRDSCNMGVSLGEYEDAKESMRKTKLEDQADAYNECELHDEQYNNRYEWDLFEVEIKT